MNFITKTSSKRFSYFCYFRRLVAATSVSGMTASIKFYSQFVSIILMLKHFLNDVWDKNISLFSQEPFLMVFLSIDLGFTMHECSII